MRAILAVAALLVFPFGSSAAFAQSPSFQLTSVRLRAIEDVKHYYGMAVAYRNGNDEVVSELQTWDKRRLGLAVAFIDSNDDPNKPWGDEVLRSGALLQTAAALKSLERGDGARMSFHVNLAAEHLRRGSVQLAPFASRWTYAISRLLRSRNSVENAETLLASARKDLPGDPLVLFESASLEEMQATRWESTPFLIHRGSLRDVDTADNIGKNRAVRLQNARDWLRQSVAAAPTSVSRLHFGRVLMMRREDDEALLQLERVRKEAKDRATQYLAILFVAAVHERKGHLDDAASAYHQAIECFPEADVAYIALSEILQAAGEGDQARKILGEMLKPRPERHEPWTWYFREPSAVVRERIAALFDEGRR
jgi:tetratricopeptide (TPR) repeat protein